MQNPFAKRIEAFCAFCKSKRRIYRKRRIGGFDIAASAMEALALMMFIFQDWDARVFLIFVAFLAISEIFVQLRWRMNIVCPHCSFDPVLYAKNPEAAAQKVSQRLERRREDPASLLWAPLDIPKRKMPAKEAEKPVSTRGGRLSKQV